MHTAPLKERYSLQAKRSFYNQLLAIYVVICTILKGLCLKVIASLLHHKGQHLVVSPSKLMTLEIHSLLLLLLYYKHVIKRS